MLLVLLGMAEAAAAQVVTLRSWPGPRVVHGPLLDGERVAWAQASCIDGCLGDGSNSSDRVELFSVARDRPDRSLFRARIERAYSGPDGGLGWYSFLLSGQVLATVYELLIGSEADVDSFGEAELRAGRRGAARELLADCRSASFFFSAPAPAALDGSRLAYDPDPCDELARLVVRDVVTGETVALPAPAGGSLLRLRGRFLAWIEGLGAQARLVVYDLEAGGVAYSVPAVDVLALDLDADGTVAAVSGRPGRPCSTGRLLRYSVAAPGPSDLGPACATGVGIDGGRIVHLGWEGSTRTLQLLTPNDGSQNLVRFGLVQPGAFDFDGERVAWSARDCGGGEAIFTARLADAPLDAGSINCRARFGLGVVPVRRGVATVRLRCSRGCGGELSLRHVGRRAFSLLRGESAVRIRLRGVARARLERRGSLPALAKIVTFNRAGDRSARARGVTLVAR